jgi:hypothetical protein
MDRVLADQIIRIAANLAQARPTWARIGCILAMKEREDRLFATLLDRGSTAAERRGAAEAIAKTYPGKLSGGSRLWGAWRALARERGQSQLGLLRECLALGLLDAARPERLAKRGTIKIARDDDTSGLRFHVYRDTAPGTLPPLQLRHWLKRQAFKAAADVIGAGPDGRKPRQWPNIENIGTMPAIGPAALPAASDLRRVLPLLSPRERQVLAGWLGGESTATIAGDLGINPASVRAFKRRIRQKIRE